MKRRIGLIADTHGLLRPEALAALAGSEAIVHAGDIGTPDVLASLARVAPLTAVRGNNDRGAWARDLPDTAVLHAGAVSILVLHDVATLGEGAAAGHAVVIAGHSHRPGIERRGDVLFVNPGSAGPRRFSLPVSVGMLVIDGSAVEAAIVALELAPHARR